jgi:hypothetical protein
MLAQVVDPLENGGTSCGIGLRLGLFRRHFLTLQPFEHMSPQQMFRRYVVD